MINKIIQGMPAPEYHSIDALSASGAKQLLKTPAHYIASRNSGPPTAAMLLGTVVHTMVLEPGNFDAEVAVCPKFDMRTKFGKQSREEFEETTNGKIVIDEFKYERAKGISESLRSHPFFKEHVKNGEAETTMMWEQYGVQCKARVDYIAKDVIYDVKTCQDASPSGFSKQIAKFQYHIQAAHYLFGRKQLAGVNLDRANFVFLAVESEPPYSCGIYTLTSRSLKQGLREIARAAERFASIGEAEPHKNYTDGVMEISLPSWAIDEELL